MGAFSLAFVCAGVARREWPYGVGAAAAATVAIFAWLAHDWWQRRFDEWHPDGVDLCVLEDTPRDEVASILAAASRARTGTVAAEADRLADVLRTAPDRPPKLSPEMAAAWDERLDVESLAASRLSALSMGGLPDASWCDDIDRRMLDTPSWRGYWPDRARIVDSSLDWLRSVSPA